MAENQLDGVMTFLAVAELCSFTAAALRLGVSPTAVSKTVRLMEKRHGVQLFQRTTRRVALTEAGQALFVRLRPAAGEIADALSALGMFRSRPAGTLRITAPRIMGAALFATLIARFRLACPDVTLDISLDDGFVDLVAGGYDAGIRLGEALDKDMVAVRLTPEIHWGLMATPAYFLRAGRPSQPEDLVTHEALRYRFTTSQAVHQWGFRRGAREFVVEVDGKLIVNDRKLLLDLASQGLGLAFMSYFEAREPLASGALEAVLSSFIPVDHGIYLYFPARSQHQPKLRAFIDTLREMVQEAGFTACFPLPDAP